MDRRASDIATFFTPTVRAMVDLIHEVAVMLKKTRFADPRVLHKAIATRARAHPDIAVTMDIREISRDQDAIRGLYRIADDQGPVEFPVMLKAISRLFNRRVANAIARRLLLRLQECADKARGVIMNGGLIADLFAPREGIFYLPGGPTPGIPEIYNILRARERTAHGRPHAEILSDADIAGLSPQLRARILRLKKNASP